MNLKDFEIWFITGSQHLYGEDTLKKVATHSTEIAAFFDASEVLPVRVIFKPVVKTPEEIWQIMRDANAAKTCVGIITWMHTFSPAKMWINGLNELQKPLLHLHTQYNRNIHFNTIDMNFMNLNQSAHGDREFAHLLTKMNIKRKTVVGHWQDEDVLESINVWSRVSVAVNSMKSMKVARFGDNMREVSVTDGDKVAAQMKFGFSVNTHPVGDLVKVINEVSQADIDTLITQYHTEYEVMEVLKKGQEKYDSIVEAARIELGIKAFLEAGDFSAYTNTFEDLHGMRQLPGIASQRLMAAGYGYGAEGDWKTSALLRILKIMATGMKGGNSFMEDYTYHFDTDNPMVLGSHMLEICPSISSGAVYCEVHPLGIGGKEDPVRLVFNGDAGPAMNVSLVDLGDRFRLIINLVDGLEVNEKFRKLPTARVLWQPKPSMKEGLKQWLEAGGAHHTVYSQNLSLEYMEDFARIFNLELVVIE
jgi:L-arabinose isomerase